MSENVPRQIEATSFDEETARKFAMEGGETGAFVGHLSDRYNAGHMVDLPQDPVAEALRQQQGQGALAIESGDRAQGSAVAVRGGEDVVPAPGSAVAVRGNEVAVRRSAELDRPMSSGALEMVQVFGTPQRADGWRKDGAAKVNEYDLTPVGGDGASSPVEMLSLLADNHDLFASPRGRKALVAIHVIVSENGGTPADANALLKRFVDHEREIPEDLEPSAPVPAPIIIEEDSGPRPLELEQAEEPEPVPIPVPTPPAPAGRKRLEDFTDEDWDEVDDLDDDYEDNVQPQKDAMYEAMERYTRITGKNRGDNLGRLEGSGSGRGGKFLKFANRVLHPLQGKRSRAAYTERQDARREFNAAVKGYTDKVTAYNRKHGVEFNGDGHNRATLAKLNLLDIAEDRVMYHETNLADDRVYNAHSADYDRPHESGLKSWMHERGKKFAVNWYNSGKAGKIFKVVLPAAAAGAGIGAISFLTGGVVPGAVFAAAGAYAGKRIGHAEADAASRRMVLDRGRQAQLRGQANARRDSLIADTDLTASPDNVDITNIHNGMEAGTNRRIGENMRRHAINESLASAVGGVAAGLVSGNGLFNTDLFRRSQGHAAAVEHTKHVKHAVKHAKHVASAAHPKGSLNANGYPWDVAHQAAEKGYIPQGHEMQTIQQYNVAYNHAHGTNFGLEHFTGQQPGVESVSEAPGVAQSAAEQAAYEHGLANFILTGKV